MAEMELLRRSWISASELSDRVRQERAKEDARRVFGWEPESVQFPETAGPLRELVCFVRVRFGASAPIEFIFVNGALLAVPPKKQARGMT